MPSNLPVFICKLKYSPTWVEIIAYVLCIYSNQEALEKGLVQLL